MAKLSFKPLGGRVLIEPLEQEEMTAGGIILPETAKEKPQEGKVLAIGPGDRDDQGNRIAMDLKVGDRVLFAKYSGQEVPRGILPGEEEYLVLKESDILAKVSG